jgi:hypothetical protein
VVSLRITTGDGVANEGDGGRNGVGKVWRDGSRTGVSRLIIRWTSGSGSLEEERTVMGARGSGGRYLGLPRSLLVSTLLEFRWESTEQVRGMIPGQTLLFSLVLLALILS